MCHGPREVSQSRRVPRGKRQGRCDRERGGIGQHPSQYMFEGRVDVESENIQDMEGLEGLLHRRYAM